MRAITAALALSATLYAGAAGACGHCVEDKVASVYDYAVAQRAFSQKQQVAFFGIDGPLVVNDDSRRALDGVARGIAGVDAASLRVSLDTASLSIAFDPRRTGFAALQKALEKRLASRQLTLLPMRVMDAPATLKAAPK